MSEDARRAIRDSRPSYAADSVRDLLRMASDRDTAKVGMIQRIYLSRRVSPAPDIVEVLDHVGHLADALGRDDDEREALATAFREVDVGQDKAWLRLANVWLKHIGVEVDGPRHLCTACWTEGAGSAPRACPKCGAVGAWFITATHGNRPLKELLTGLLSDYQLPPEDVLVKPSERPDEDEVVDPRDEIDRVNLSVWLKSEMGVDIPESDLEILARCPVLWSGWEADSSVLLYRIRSTGRTDLWVVDGGHIEDQSGGIVGTLKERLAAYRDAIAQTEAFLGRVAEQMPGGVT